MAPSVTSCYVCVCKNRVSIYDIMLEILRVIRVRRSVVSRRPRRIGYDDDDDDEKGLYLSGGSFSRIRSPPPRVDTGSEFGSLIG